MPAQQDIGAEQAALKTFGDSLGKMPSTPQDWGVLHKMAYGTIDNLPDQYKNDPATLSAFNSSPKDAVRGAVTGGAPTPPVAPTTLQGLATQGQNDLNKATTDRSAAIQQAQDLNTGTGSFFRTLQNAIKAKTGSEQTPTGDSALFKQAGLTGFDSLNQSLSMRKSEIDSSSNYLTDVLTNMGGIFQTQAANVKLGYDDAVSRYNRASDEVQKSATAIADNKAQIDRLYTQHNLDQQAKQWDLSHPTIANQITARNAGYIVKDGALVPDNSLNNGIVMGFDMGNYATDPSYVQALGGLVSTIGKFNAPQDVTDYISKIQPNSPINFDMIAETSQKYGIPWEMLVGLTQKESLLGTSGVAKKDNNLGGITWSQAYQDEHPGTSKGSARPEGGNYVKFLTPQDGLDAVGQNLQGRKTAESQTAETTSDQKSYAQVGLLANTDYQPTNQIDGEAKVYMDYYIKNGTIPTPYQIGLGRGTSTGATARMMSNVASRAQALFFNATGSSLPDPTILKSNKSLVIGNNKLLNTLGIQEGTVQSNFDLAIGQMKDKGVNENIPIINRVLDPVMQMLGDTDVQAYMASNSTLQNEAASLIAVKNASGTTVYDKLMSSGLILKDASVDQQIAIVTRLEKEAENARNTIASQNSDLYTKIDPLEQLPDNPNRQKKLSAAQGPQPGEAKEGDTHDFNGTTYKFSNGQWTSQ